MKYGQYLLDNIAPEYGPDVYLDYRRLNDIIRALSGRPAISKPQEGQRQISLTTPPPTDSTGQPVAKDEDMTEELFFTTLDKEISKVESFTLDQVKDLRKKLIEAESSIKSSHHNNEDVKKSADSIGESFIRLEKYVNLNFMGFHKILKKHDRHLPTNPCKMFYVNRMHNQAWVRGDYSDLVVRLSDIYSALRDDVAAEEQSGATGSFLRSTTKYWIKTEDVSRVKYYVLKHLPVFLQKTATGESDSQLTNSVYLDNDQLELYHGRLDKTPGAIALRLRWYGTGEPKIVFVERKTHRDSWTGEVSVKERFIVNEKEVRQVLTDHYPIPSIKQEMLEKKKVTEKEAQEWEILATECTQVIQSKQLVPTMRTQYMRTAFQIPFDATVRISLDTNLCMISERGYNLQDGAQWHRDPSKTLNDTEITRFPHAILEIKLELNEANATPPLWVQELQNSGMLYEVHKFSKFLHGCSVLLPEYVRSVPYWIDDASVRDSILASGAGKILVRKESGAHDRAAGAGPGANQIYTHLLPFGTITEDKKDAVGRTAANVVPAPPKPSSDLAPTTAKKEIYHPYEEEEEEEEPCCDCSWPFPFCSAVTGYELSVVAPTSVQKVEPKLFFANERTFLHWLHAGVTLSTIASGILAFEMADNSARWAHWYAMLLLPLALGYCLYALHVFLWRADRIKTRIPGRWDDPRGPIFLGGTLCAVMVVQLVIKVYQIIKYAHQ